MRNVNFDMVAHYCAILIDDFTPAKGVSRWTVEMITRPIEISRQRQTESLQRLY